MKSKWPFIFALVVLGILIADAIFALPAKHKQVGHALVELRYDHSAWKFETITGESIGYRVTQLNPVYRKDWRRYGYDCAFGLFGDPNRSTKRCGKFVRPYLMEDVSIHIITTVIRLNDNPLGIVNNRSYIPTDRDIKDIMMAYNPYTKKFAYYEVFLPLYSSSSDISRRSTGLMEYELGPSFDVKPE